MSASLTNPLVTLAGYQIRRVSAAIMDELAQELALIDLRPPTASIIMLIGANPLIKPSDIGRELGIQRANITPLIATLERDGLVQRHAINGRSHGLALTPKGEAAQGGALRLMWRSDETMLARLDPAERLQFVHMLSLVWGEVRNSAHATREPRLDAALAEAVAD